LEITGTAVFRIVVSSDSMKKATATSHGSMRLIAAEGTSELVLAEANLRLPSCHQKAIKHISAFTEFPIWNKAMPLHDVESPSIEVHSLTWSAQFKEANRPGAIVGVSDNSLL